MMGETGIDEFVARQTDPVIKSIEKSCLLTLGGIKVLTQKYPNQKKEWRLVV
jgi:hypothetical protein